MKTYKTLSHTQRLQIECLLKAKLPIRQIAENIGVHISTVYRELKRGEYMHRVKVSEYIGYHYKEVKAYSPDIAQEKYDINKTARGGRLKIGKNKEFADYVEHRILVDGISPFADVDGLQRSIYGGQRTTMYYCHPYRSNERGTNERINREIRRKLPKGTNFHKYGQSDIDVVEKWINSYPRKVLGFATSQEMFDEELTLLC